MIGLHWGFPLAALIAGIALLPTLLGPSHHSALSQWAMLAVLATSWNWIGGLAGRLALTQHSFVGLGGYLVAIASIAWGLHPLFGLIAGVLLAIGLTWLVAAAATALGIKDLYFALLTLAVAEVIFGLFQGVETRWFIGGLQLPLVDDPARLLFRNRSIYFYVYLALLALCLFAQGWFRRSRNGRLLSALRDDETAAASLGQRPLTWIFLSYAMSSVVAVAVGAVLVQEQLAARTDGIFDFNLMVLIITSTVLGGLGSWFGGALGAAVVVAVDQLVVAASLNAIPGGATFIHGAMLLLAINFLPGGVVGVGSRVLKRFA